MVVHHGLLGFNYTNRVEKNNILSEYTKHIFINCNMLVLKLNYMFFDALVCLAKYKEVIIQMTSLCIILLIRGEVIPP